MTKTRFVTKPGHALPLGVTKVQQGVQFAIYLPGRKKCFLKLYKKNQPVEEYRIALTDEYRFGSVYFVILELAGGCDATASLSDMLTEQYEYLYEADGVDLMDPYAAAVSGRECFGKRKEGGFFRSQIRLTEFDWEQDHPLHIPFSDMIMYQLHVRGFTRHSSSNVTYPGTYSGVIEKIPYLKELGINGVFMLPVYDFEEMQDTTLNYWGYGAASTYYFSPKASYSQDAQKNDIAFKQMVKQLHQAGIEVLLDFYFLPGTNLTLMLDCLRYWVMEYHVDGFRVNTEVMPSISLASDPILSGVKLLASYWDPQMLQNAGIQTVHNSLAEYNEGFMNDARRYLKSDEGQVPAFFQRFYYHPKNADVINFMTHVNGFTMMDLVSYDIKHNESNGERNHDGTEFNYSWNCGVEGKTRKKTIRQCRMKQIRNAFTMLLLSQGTPMILAGDEFGNSQDGNNNPYCQDNAVTWLNWKETKTGTQIFSYVKQLIAFRKEHGVLHNPQPLMLMDSLSCGMPDLSAHGIQTWRPDFSNYNRMLGILLYGEYAKDEKGVADDSVYIIYNMYWEERAFDLPTLPNGMEWHLYLDTKTEDFFELPPHKKKTKKKRNKVQVKKQPVVASARSIMVFVSR